MSKDIRWKYSNFIENKNYEFNKEKILNILSKKNIDEAYNIISGWEDYKPTPLLLLNKLSVRLCAWLSSWVKLVMKAFFSLMLSET